MSGVLLERSDTIPVPTIPSFGGFLRIVADTVSDTNLDSPICVKLGWNAMTGMTVVYVCEKQDLCERCWLWQQCLHFGKKNGSEPLFSLQGWCVEDSQGCPLLEHSLYIKCWSHLKFFQTAVCIINLYSLERLKVEQRWCCLFTFLICYRPEAQGICEQTNFISKISDFVWFPALGNFCVTDICFKVITSNTAIPGIWSSQGE